MKILYTIIFFCFTYSVTMVGQEAQFRVISCFGDVTHQADGHTSKVVAGAKISPEGSLVLGDDAKVKLICKDKPYTISDSGDYDLKLLYEGSAQRSMSFTGKFWNFIMEGLTKSDSKDDLITYHRKYASVSGGIKGYTSKKSGIKILQPYAGKITNGNFLVSWDAESSQNNFIVSILNSDDRYQICKKNVDANNTQIAIDDCEMVLGNRYFLRIESDAKVFDEILIEFVQLDESKINRRLSSLIDYDESTEKEKVWMRATVLEMEGYLEDAHTAYQKLIANNPNDGFIKKLYNLFLVRNNQIDKVNIN